MIVVTGASGHLGRLVLDELAVTVDPAEIVAAVRSPEKAADIAGRGFVVRLLDYDDPETIAPALAGAEQVLLISGSDVGRRIPQHTAVIEGAVEAGVEHIAYTSILRADTSRLLAALEHRATEEILAKVDVATTRLRHGWYVENYTENLAPALATGALIGAAGDGRIAAAARADLAAADSAVLVDGDLRGGTYELGGPAFTMVELAAAVSEVAGREIGYVDMQAEDLGAALRGAGVPDPMVDFLVDADLGIAQGELYVEPETLQRLSGRPPTPLAEAVAAALGG